MTIALPGRHTLQNSRTGRRHRKQTGPFQPKESVSQMDTPKYAELAHRQAWESSLLPGSPASRGLPSRRPGTSRHLERLHKITTVAELVRDDPQLAAAGWVVAP